MNLLFMYGALLYKNVYICPCIRARSIVKADVGCYNDDTTACVQCARVPLEGDKQRMLRPLRLGCSARCPYKNTSAI